MHVENLERNLKKPGLRIQQGLRFFALRPLCIITQSLMHVTASESLSDFGKKQK